MVLEVDDHPLPQAALGVLCYPSRALPRLTDRNWCGHSIQVQVTVLGLLL